MLNDPQENVRRRIEHCPIAPQKVAQPLGHRQYPLAHRHARKNMVHLMRCRLRHAPRVARGAHLAALAGQGYKIVVAAVTAPGPRIAVGKDTALQVFAKRLLHIGQRGVVLTLTVELAGTAERKPGLEVIGSGRMAQRQRMGCAPWSWTSARRSPGPQSGPQFPCRAARRDWLLPAVEPRRIFLQCDFERDLRDGISPCF